MEYIKIPLYGKIGTGRYTLVDGDYDGEYFSTFKWYLNPCGYVIRRAYEYDKSKSFVYLHSEVQRSYNGLWVDHINRDKLDNRSCNLRLLTPSENRLNSCDLNGKKMTEDEKKYKRKMYADIYKNNK